MAEHEEKITACDGSIFTGKMAEQEKNATTLAQGKIAEGKQFKFKGDIANAVSCYGDAVQIL